MFLTAPSPPQAKAGGERMCVCVSRVMGAAVTIDTGMRPDPERRTERATAL
ncbi:hypothetical protein AB0I98_08845 [Streptomyces sp. NPDC050211]|uniref:hypothetical protein n=1 Tax=Streptomyces sp. NPDC050211 TaxID=3154932 RepID=UPI00343D070F